MLIELSYQLANPASFWKFIKKQRYNSDIPKTLTFNGASSTNAADMFASTSNLSTHVLLLMMR